MVRQAEIQTAKPLDLKPSSFEAGIAIERFTRYRSLVIDSAEVKNGGAVFLLLHMPSWHNF
jgi:hypothetical protein